MIVLSPSMSRRQMVSEDTVGTAVVTRCDGGLAYVSFDRVRRVADASARNAMDMMGLVMAHEIGHLLLPHGSHSYTGLMRANWDVKDLRLIERADLRFTSAQADLIREGLRRSPDNAAPKETSRPLLKFTGGSGSSLRNLHACDD